MDLTWWPPHLRQHDLITIELVDAGPRDGLRARVPAYHLSAGWYTPEQDGPPELHEITTFDSPSPTYAAGALSYRQRLWRWDGGATDDSAYTFRPVEP